MYKHELKINVRRPGEKPISITDFKKLSWFKSLTSKWFGRTLNINGYCTTGQLSKN